MREVCTLFFFFLVFVLVHFVWLFTVIIIISKPGRPFYSLHHPPCSPNLSRGFFLTDNLTSAYAITVATNARHEQSSKRENYQSTDHQAFTALSFLHLFPSFSLQYSMFWGGSWVREKRGLVTTDISLEFTFKRYHEAKSETRYYPPFEALWASFGWKSGGWIRG